MDFPDLTLDYLREDIFKSEEVEFTEKDEKREFANGIAVSYTRNYLS